MYPSSLLGAACDLTAVPLPERPRLAPWLTLVDLGDGRLQLRAADFAFTLSERLFAGALGAIQPLLDGQHDVARICEAAAPTYLSGTVLFVLKILTQAGALYEGAPAAELQAAARERFDAVLRLFAHYTTEPEPILARLQRAEVAVVGSEALALRLADALERSGVGHVQCVPCATRTPAQLDLRATRADLVVAVADTPALAFFDAINTSRLATGARWLRVAAHGSFALLGPTVVPRQTACFTCCRQRAMSHDDAAHFQAYEREVAARGEGYEGTLPGLVDTLAGQTAIEVMRLLCGFAPPATLGRYHVLQANSPLVTAHDVLRVPRCPSCGPRMSPRDPWDVRASRKAEA
jgi:bacteriocin biosynthesis cyclodehydratase domain-containing protein